MDKIQVGHVSKYHMNCQVLCHQICSVGLARDLGQRDDLPGALLLQPQAVYIYMTHFGNPLPIDNVLRSSRIQLQSDADIGAKIHAEGLDAQSLAGSSHDPVELGLCRALGDDCLGL